VNWAVSYAYADGGTDVDLMSQVGHPVAVFPDDILRAVAQSRGWPILDGEDP
jgi:putative phosphoserine phosphatase/1-acylglycerol-3-phosphate O-acyltransferase